MRVHVETVEQVDDQVLVSFTCSVGQGRAVWRASYEPEEAHDYEAEFSVQDPLKDWSLKAGVVPSELALRGTNMRFTGVVDEVDEDGVVYVRLARDCLIMLDGVDVEVGSSATFEVPVQQVELFPFSA